MNWEDWLRAASRPPSANEEAQAERTENQIREALRNYKPLEGVPYRIYTKGSYANNTNVRLNYDVDIAVEYEGFFYYDLCFELAGQPKETVGIGASDDPYTRDDFKRDIRAALVKAFGESSIKDGRIAYRVREKKTTLPADVVPCWEYRRYDRKPTGTPTFHKGSRVFPGSGGHKDNFPEIQVTNGNAKNKATARRYKRMVRALKRLQTYMIDNGSTLPELPSYLIECLVYNVPNQCFGNTTYLADMRQVLATIFNETLNNGDAAENWHEVHELRYLFKGNADWTVKSVHDFAGAAWDTLGFS